jgi:hypothetical protein
MSSEQSSFSPKDLLDITDDSTDIIVPEASISISNRYEALLSLNRLKAISVAVAINFYFGSNPVQARKAGSLLLREKFKLDSNSTEVRLYHKLVSKIPEKFRNHVLYNFRSVLEDHDSLSEESVTCLVNHFETYFWDCHSSITQSHGSSIPLSTWDRILTNEKSDSDDKSQDSPTRALTNSISSEEHSCWVFILFDVILRVQGLR